MIGFGVSDRKNQKEIKIARLHKEAQILSISWEEF
jgi:hypothetical protein